MWNGLKALFSIFAIIVAVFFGIIIIMSSLAFFIKFILIGVAIGLGIMLVKKLFN